eukprot:CAMPEP_0179052692 /NCGR_PEP_ID=MMETSP0796-20121207/21887_1 /TAXON_ID=73915 /ORGANISM="Pyrodinium bahamense, Strain pbaha01" /LENGTH=41 /DNA_ID= /DNA_START= /DNA_END= /DNA_ORIENTATION=
MAKGSSKSHSAASSAGSSASPFPCPSAVCLSAALSSSKVTL